MIKKRVYLYNGGYSGWERYDNEGPANCVNEPDKKAVENTVRKNILVKKEIKVDDSQGYNSDEVD